MPIANTNTPLSADQIAFLQAGQKRIEENKAKSGTMNGQTASQNLANVYNSGVDPAKPVIPTPYISGVLSQAAKDNAAQTTQTGNVGTTPTPTPAPAPTTAPVQTAATAVPSQYKDPYARTPDQIAALAKARIDAILQGGRTAAAGSLTSLRNANDYTNTIKGDNRVLRNATFKETSNPFSGQTGYLAAQTLRNDSIQDTAQNKDYNANVQLVQQKLADLETAAPGQEQQIIDDLQQIERTTGINVARLQMEQQNSAIGNAATIGSQTGQFTNPLTGQTSQTVAGKTADLNNQGQTLQNQLTQMKLDNYPAESKAAAAEVQQKLTAGQLDIDTAKFKLEQLKDENSPLNQAAKLDLQMKQIDAKNYPREAQLKLEQLQKQINQIGAAPYRSQDQLDYDKQQVIKIKAEIEKLNTAANNPKSTPVDSKLSSDNHALLTTDIKDAKDAAEANALIEANKANLTDADYKDLKKQVIDKF